MLTRCLSKAVFGCSIILSSSKGSLLKPSSFLSRLKCGRSWLSLLQTMPSVIMVLSCSLAEIKQIKHSDGFSVATIYTSSVECNCFQRLSKLFQDPPAKKKHTNLQLQWNPVTPATNGSQKSGFIMTRSLYYRGCLSKKITELVSVRARTKRSYVVTVLTWWP